ncbi:MAG: hypothetical protein ACXAC2_23755, partial [Candidatus Kariarchaeaceae archaeon]
AAAINIIASIMVSDSFIVFMCYHLRFPAILPYHFLLKVYHLHCTRTLISSGLETIPTSISSLLLHNFIFDFTLSNPRTHQKE